MTTTTFVYYTSTVTMSLLLDNFSDTDFVSEAADFFANPLILSLLLFVVVLAFSQAFMSLLKRSIQ